MADALHLQTLFAYGLRHMIRRYLKTLQKWFDLYRGIVMLAQCDLYGHMNVRYYAALFDDAGWHILSCAGISLAKPRARGLGSVVASLTIDFHHEMKAGNLVVIQGSFTRVGVKSFSYEMRLYE